MGELEKKIAGDLRASIKNKDATRTSTLRMLTASMQNLGIDKKTQELGDQDVLEIIYRHVKQHHDSIDSFKKGGRADLVEKESKELEIIKSYLPEQFDEERITEVVKKTISKIGANSQSDFGKVMKLSMEELKGRADARLISSIVQKLLVK